MLKPRGRGLCSGRIGVDQGERNVKDSSIVYGWTVGIEMPAALGTRQQSPTRAAGFAVSCAGLQLRHRA